MSRKEWQSSKDGWAVIGGMVVAVTCHIGSEWDTWRPHQVRRIVRRGGSPRSPKLGEYESVHASPQEAHAHYLAELKANEDRFRTYMETKKKDYEEAQAVHSKAAGKVAEFEAIPCPDCTTNEEKP